MNHKWFPITGTMVYYPAPSGGSHRSTLTQRCSRCGIRRSKEDRYGWGYEKQWDYDQEDFPGGTLGNAPPCSLRILRVEDADVALRGLRRSSVHYAKIAAALDNEHLLLTAKEELNDIVDLLETHKQHPSIYQWTEHSPHTIQDWPGSAPHAARLAADAADAEARAAHDQAQADVVARWTS